MNKFRFDIQKNNLSWEKSYLKNVTQINAIKRVSIKLQNQELC